MDYDFYSIKIKLTNVKNMEKDYYIGDWDVWPEETNNDTRYPLSLIMPIAEDIFHAAQFDDLEGAEEIAKSLKYIWNYPIVSTEIIGRNYGQD